MLHKKTHNTFLIRARPRLCPLGLPWHRRFSFYDQVHTTGMDIKQCLDAAAVCTLGKDMTFRAGLFRNPDNPATFKKHK